MGRLNNKRALITGASRGIGRQICIGLAAEGCDLILHASQAENCAQTLERLEDFAVEKMVVGGLLGSPEQEQRMIETVMSEIGAVDILYNNAGVMSQWHDQVAGIPAQEWNRVFEINFFALMRLCNAFYPSMLERKWGRIVNLVTGMQNTPQLLPYNASKAAVEKFSCELAVELAPANVLVNCLDPGWLKTDMGGESADYEVESVLPGALQPALLDDYGPSGKVFAAQDYRLESTTVAS